MAKKIKSFTADEDIYNKLVSMFKKYNAETSISMYLNNQIKYLLEHLEDLEKGIQEKKSSVPMKYVIEETVKDSSRSGKISDEIDEYKQQYQSDLDLTLEDWEKSYNADQEGIPYEYYDLVKSGNYELSRDKKFLIDKKTGEKFVWSEGTLMQVKEKKKK